MAKEVLPELLSEFDCFRLQLTHWVQFVNEADGKCRWSVDLLGPQDHVESMCSAHRTSETSGSSPSWDGPEVEFGQTDPRTLESGETEVTGQG